MNMNAIPRRIVCFVAATMLCTAPVSASGQENEVSSRRETDAAKTIEDAGGRVYRISAADTSREISFALSGKPVGDQQIAGINAVAEVIWLNLAGAEITNDGLKHLAGMPLQKLHLERTKIGDDGLKHLKSFKDLTYLNIYDTKVTDAGLEHLKDLKNLKKLYVWKSAVTDAGMKRLNESLPGLEIVGELKLEPVVIEEPKEEDAAAKKDKQGDEKKDKQGDEKKDGDPKADSKKTKPADESKPAKGDAQKPAKKKDE